MQQSGVSLIEVLVSVIVMAIGLLGLAALQGSAVRFNHSAELRSIANSQAQSMIDRMRANKQGVESGFYNNLSGLPSQTQCSACSPAQLAQYDLYQFNTTNAQLLPSGQGQVTGNGRVFTITIFWDNDRSGATGTNCSGNTALDLTCLSMSVEL